MKKICQTLRLSQYLEVVKLSESVDTATFRSLIKTYFPVDLLVKLELIAADHKISNNEKTEKLLIC